MLPIAASAAGSIASAGIGAGLGVWGAKSAARDEYQYNKKMYQHRYQWQVKDMMKAGLNPMLAFSQGAPVPGHVGVDNIGATAVEGAKGGFAARMQSVMARSQIANLSADTELKTASATAAREQARKTGAEANVLSEFGSAKAGAEIDEIRTRIEEAGYRMAESVARTDLDMQKWAHNEKHYPIIRELDQALADAKQADIPLKEVVAMLASMFGGLINRAKSETEKRNYEGLARDTLNMVEDKWDKINPWEAFKRWDRNRRSK